jgi:phage-related protein
MSFIEQFNYNRDLIAGKGGNPDHGYSLFNLNGDPNQYVVDVVDVSTNTTGSYTATDLKDGTLEADITNIGVVSKFYDQFGGKHATGINTGEMPYIITGGSFVELNNKPAMIFRSGSRNAYLIIKNEGYNDTEPGDLSSHILGVNGLETFTVASLDVNATTNLKSSPYSGSYVFGENYNYSRKDFGVGFINKSSNRFYLYTERGEYNNNSFSGFSIAEDNNATKYGFGYTGETVNLGQRYIINTFAGFDSTNSSGIVGLGDGQNYISGYVSTGRNNYIVGSIGSDESYDETFKGRLQEVLFYTSLRDDRATIYSEIQNRLSNDLDYLASDTLTISPVYGSSISFNSDNYSWRGSNYYQFIMPNGLNSIKAEMNLTFQGNKGKIKNLLNRIEKATTGTITGDAAFSGAENCINFGELKHGVQINLDTDYYRNFQGSQILNYNLRHVSNNVYELDVSMFNNKVSPILNHGMGFVANKVNYNTGNFEKFDVVDPRPIIDLNSDGGTGEYIDLTPEIYLGADFDIYFSFIASTFSSSAVGAGTDGAYFLADKDGSNSRIFYHGTLNEIWAKVGGNEVKWYNIYLETFKKYDIRITRRGSVLNLYIDGENKGQGSQNGGTSIARISRIGSRYAGQTNVASLMGSIFDISIKDGLNTVYEVRGDGNTDSDWDFTNFNASVVGSPGVYDDGIRQSESFNNYFYMNQDNASPLTSSISGLTTYTGAADGSTRTFFWEPDQQVSLPVDHSARINDFKRSFTQQLNISHNQNRIDALDLTFTNRSEKETYSILHFLESHLGYKQFVYYYDDDIIQQNRVFFCPQWRHTFNYKDSNTIEARFIEIVAPVTPEF